MNWKLKAHGLAVLSRIPAGRRVYHSLQSWLGTNKLKADEYVRRALEIVEMIRQAGREPGGRVYLEVGTGWRPFVPFILSLVGAERVLTLDVNRWLTAAYALETHQAIAAQLPAIAGRLGLDLAALRGRYEAISPREGDLQGLLDAYRVEYRCPGDARATGLAGQSVDFVCSSNVLEHVPPDVLRDIHREALRIVRPNGLAVHRFNPGDHWYQVDKSITTANFLRFSPEQWRWYGGTGLAYHNRLRCAQHLRLFEEAGFSVLHHRERIDPRALEVLEQGQLDVHPDFAGFSPQELAADYMWVVCARPQ